MGSFVKFEVLSDTAGKPYWRLRSNNSQTVAWSGETFSSEYAVKQAAQAFKAGAKTARYVVYKDSGGKYRWRAWRSSDIVASSGESFYGEWEANRAAENVRDNAGGATGP